VKRIFEKGRGEKRHPRVYPETFLKKMFTGGKKKKNGK